MNTAQNIVEPFYVPDTFVTGTGSPQLMGDNRRKTMSS
jgi:hypothetical protein